MGNLGIPDKHVKEICRIGQGFSACRYLSMGMFGYRCEKNTNMKSYIDHRASVGAIKSMGDNCKGYERVTALTEVMDDKKIETSD